MVKSRYIGDGHPTFNDGILIMGIFSPLRTWVDEFIPYFMEMSWELIDPIAHMLVYEPPFLLGILMVFYNPHITG